MLKFTVICPVVSKHKYLEEFVDTFKTRMQKDVVFSLLEFKSKAENNSNVDQVKEEEGNFILKLVPKNSFLIVMDQFGKQFESEDFAEIIKKNSVQGFSHFCFIIGGAYGLSDSVLKAARIKISLSKMTFTYQIAKLVLIEQLYRITTIITGKPYHK
jgi:23S rRNA (pseudouridine1915-N3)-methyltransferase